MYDFYPCLPARLQLHPWPHSAPHQHSGEWGELCDCLARVEVCSHQWAFVVCVMVGAQFCLSVRLQYSYHCLKVLSCSTAPFLVLWPERPGFGGMVNLCQSPPCPILRLQKNIQGLTSASFPGCWGVWPDSTFRNSLRFVWCRVQGSYGYLARRRGKMCLSTPFSQKWNSQSQRYFETLS